MKEAVEIWLNKSRGADGRGQKHPAPLHFSAKCSRVSELPTSNENESL